MNSGIKHILLILSIALISAPGIMAQDAELANSKLQAAYYKDQNNLERIAAKLLLKAERYEPFANAEVHFYIMKDTSKVLLQTVVTDDKGEAVYLFEEGATSSSDSTGLLTITVEYDGNATTESAAKDIQVKKADLKVTFFQEDTTKFISIEAFEPGETPVPIAATEIGIFIKGTFSYLNITKEATDADGKLIVPFPVDMPGDSLGVITIVARIEDNDIYGNVESWGTINWAHPVPVALEAKRGLGDTDAPLWMVYTLIVLLSAVWFHYAYVVYLIVKIKLAKHHA